jgi:hypothetical protein
LQPGMFHVADLSIVAGFIVVACCHFFSTRRPTAPAAPRCMTQQSMSKGSQSQRSRLWK